MSSLILTVAAKRVELLHEVTPAATSLAYLANRQAAYRDPKHEICRSRRERRAMGSGPKDRISDCQGNQTELLDGVASSWGIIISSQRNAFH
jgi:hypothetical protein